MKSASQKTISKVMSELRNKQQLTMTAEQRKARAVKAAKARWSKKKTLPIKK